MTYFYSDTEPKTFTPRGKQTPESEMPATKFWETHYGNFLMLDFFAKNETGFNERAQANKELVICRRKMEYWERHPNFDRAVSIRLATELKRKWKTN